MTLIEKANEIMAEVKLIDARVSTVLDLEDGVFIRGSFRGKKHTEYKYNVATGQFVYNMEGFYVPNAIDIAAACVETRAEK